MGSLNPIGPQVLKSIDIVDGWRNNLPKWDAGYMHLPRNVLIEKMSEENTLVKVKGVSFHKTTKVEVNNEWRVAGLYTIKLFKIDDKLKIISSKLDVRYIDDNLNLPKIIF